MLRTLLLSEIFPPEPGGSGRWFFESYRRLGSESCVFAVGEHAEASQFDVANEDLDIRRLELRMQSRGIASLRSILDYGKRFRDVRRLVRVSKCAQIHAARPLFEGLVAKWVSSITGVPYLCYIHGEDVAVAKTSRELTMMTRWVLNSAKVLVANSGFTKRLLENEWNVDSKRIAVVNPGVDTNYFQPAERSLTIREKLGWGERKVVLTVGRLQERKGHDVCLRAFSRVIREMPDALYAIVGNGEMLSELRELTKSLGLRDHVVFHRGVTDEVLLSCYQQCDLFCLPNRQVGADVEGFGMVLLEAQSCEKPVIAGMSGGTAETMLETETGFIIDCTEPTLLAKKLIELLNDQKRRETMGERAREFVCEKFDWQAVAERSRQVFEAI